MILRYTRERNLQPAGEQLRHPLSGIPRERETARARDWTVLSMRDDWRQVFPDLGGE
jgi:hypothetical protein